MIRVCFLVPLRAPGHLVQTRYFCLQPHRPSLWSRSMSWHICILDKRCANQNFDIAQMYRSLNDTRSTEGTGLHKFSSHATHAVEEKFNSLQGVRIARGSSASRLIMKDPNREQTRSESSPEPYMQSGYSLSASAPAPAQALRSREPLSSLRVAGLDSSPFLPIQMPLLGNCHTHRRAYHKASLLGKATANQCKVPRYP